MHPRHILEPNHMHQTEEDEGIVKAIRDGFPGVTGPTSRRGPLGIAPHSFLIEAHHNSGANGIASLMRATTEGSGPIPSALKGTWAQEPVQAPQLTVLLLETGFP